MAKRVLDSSLVLGALDRCESLPSVVTLCCWAFDCRRSIRVSDGIAQLA